MSVPSYLIVISEGTVSPLSPYLTQIVSPFFNGISTYSPSTCKIVVSPNTEFIMNNTFWVGTFPALGEEEVTRIADTIREFVEENK